MKSILAGIALSLLVGLLSIIIMLLFGKNHLQVKDKHVYVTGASEGLGLSVAKLMLQKGAHVTIVSRSKQKLDAALKILETLRIHPNQKLHALSADLTDFQQSEATFDAACRLSGTPEVILSCVGGAGGILGLFTELDSALAKQAMDTNYFATFWTTHREKIAAKRMAAEKVKGKIVLVSSVAALVGFAGYSFYQPAKAAIRGLAECLRNELLMHEISVHCYFPGTILSPGLEAENKCKPKVTLEIEGVDEGQTPDVCAAKLIKALEANHCFITSDILGDLFRNSMRGIIPINSYIMDSLLFLIGPIVAFVWRPIADGYVRKLRRA